MVQTKAELVWRQHMDHIKARMETSETEVEPTDGGEEVEPFSGTTSSSNVEPDTANTISPNANPTVGTKSQETGSSTEARPPVMRCYSSRDRLTGLTLTFDFVVVEPFA